MFYPENAVGLQPVFLNTFERFGQYLPRNSQSLERQGRFAKILDLLEDLFIFYTSDFFLDPVSKLWNTIR